MQAHLVKRTTCPDIVKEVIELHRRGSDLDTSCGRACLADDFELGGLQRTAAQEQRIIQRLLDTDIEP